MPPGYSTSETWIHGLSVTKRRFKDISVHVCAFLYITGMTKPKDKTVYIRMPAELYNWLREQAEKENRSLSNMILRVLSERAKKEKP